MFNSSKANPYSGLPRFDKLMRAGAMRKVVPHVETGPIADFNKLMHRGTRLNLKPPAHWGMAKHSPQSSLEGAVDKAAFDLARAKSPLQKAIAMKVVTSIRKEFIASNAMQKALARPMKSFEFFRAKGSVDVRAR